MNCGLRRASYFYKFFQKKKGKVIQLEVGNKKTNTTMVVTIQGQVKTERTKPDD